MLKNRAVTGTLAAFLAFVGTGLATSDARASVPAGSPTCVRAGAVDGVHNLTVKTRGAVDGRVTSVRTNRDLWTRASAGVWTSRQTLARFDDGQYVHIVVKSSGDRWSGWVKCRRTE